MLFDACYDRESLSAFSYLTGGVLQVWMPSESYGSRGERSYFTMTWGPRQGPCLEEDLDHLAAIFEEEYRLIVSKTKGLVK